MSAVGLDEIGLAEPSEVAEYFGVTVQTLAAWRWKRRGPEWVKIGRAVRYDREKVKAWAAAGGDRSI